MFESLWALVPEAMQTLVAHTGADGVKLLRANACDLVVLDIGLPDASGLDICREIREYSDIPIIFLTARNDEIDRNAVEGKFGNLKRKGTLARVMAKLRCTSVTVVNIAIIALNLDTRLRELLLCLQIWLQQQLEYLPRHWKPSHEPPVAT